MQEKQKRKNDEAPQEKSIHPLLMGLMAVVLFLAVFFGVIVIVNLLPLNNAAIRCIAGLSVIFVIIAGLYGIRGFLPR